MTCCTVCHKTPETKGTHLNNENEYNEGADRVRGRWEMRGGRGEVKGREEGEKGEGGGRRGGREEGEGRGEKRGRERKREKIARASKKGGGRQGGGRGEVRGRKGREAYPPVHPLI